MITGLLRSIKALVYAAGLIFLIINVWSVSSVEFLQPEITELVAEGGYDHCASYAYAFVDVFPANLTRSRVITGDNWTEVLKPLCERYYWPFVYVASIIFVVCYGLLNIITVVILQASEEARYDDADFLADLSDKEMERKLAEFRGYCAEMDTDKSGDISIDEFNEHINNNGEMRAILMSMGIQGNDVLDLFELIDLNKSGSLDFDEFVFFLHDMQMHVEKTTMFYMHKNIQSLCWDMQLPEAIKKLLDGRSGANNHADYATKESQAGINMSQMSTRKPQFKRSNSCLSTFSHLSTKPTVNFFEDTDEEEQEVVYDSQGSCSSQLLLEQGSHEYSSSQHVLANTSRKEAAGTNIPNAQNEDDANTELARAEPDIDDVSRASFQIPFQLPKEIRELPLLTAQNLHEHHPLTSRGEQLTTIMGKLQDISDVLRRFIEKESGAASDTSHPGRSLLARDSDSALSFSEVLCTLTGAGHPATAVADGK